MTRLTVTIYSKPGCHLCEEAKATIESSGCTGDYTLDEINIELDPALLKQYEYDVPVILINGVKAFKHRIDANEFKRKLRRLGHA